jgi:hypothetical protein
MFQIKYIFILTALITAGMMAAYGQSNWSINPSLQYASGNYLSDQRLNSWYLYGGVRYETNAYSVSLSIPFIASNGQNVSQFGNIYIPNHMGSGSSGMGIMGGHSGGHMPGNESLLTSSSTENYGIGDLYLYANYNIINPFTSSLGLSASGYIKFPTASTANGFGTGKFDLSLSAAVRKSIGTFILYGSGGYIFLGDPDSLDYFNPFIFDLGIGKSFNNGNLSVLLNYNLYTKILDVYQPPQQLSLGININSNERIKYICILSAGLSDSAPDYVLSAGIKYNLSD